MKSVLIKTVVLFLVCTVTFVNAQLGKLKLSVPKKPTVVYDRVDVKSVSIKKTKVEFVYIVDNPNSFGVDHILADYELFLKGQSTASGKDVKFTIPAKSKQEFKLPLELNYLDVFKSAGALTKAVASGKKSIPFQMDMTFKIKIKALKFDVPITAKGDLPLPKVKTVPKLKKKKLKF